MVSEQSKIVAEGWWLYDGAARKHVQIVALPYDHWYELGRDDESLEVGEEPSALGPDGVLYYAHFGEIRGSGYPTIIQAKGFAQSLVQTDITWS